MPLTDRTRRRIFGYAAQARPDDPPPDRLAMVRSHAAEINPAGGASVSKLSEPQGRVVAARLQRIHLDEKNSAWKEWETASNNFPDLHDPLFASLLQMRRLAAVASDTHVTPVRVQAFLKKKYGISSLCFAIPSSAYRGMINWLEGRRPPRIRRKTRRKQPA